MSGIEKFRSKFEALGNSFTEEDASQDSRCGYTSERSYFEPSGPYSVQYPPSHKSTEWVSYEQESIYPPNPESNKQMYHRFALIQESLYAELESLKDDKKNLNSEIIQLKSKVIDLEKQIDSFQERLQKKDKEINKLSFDKELLKKTEEEFKKVIEELKKKNDLLQKENLEHRQNFDTYRMEKRDLLKSLKECELNIEEFKNSLKAKDEKIKVLEDALEENKKLDFKNLNAQSFKSSANKLNLKTLDLEKRAISDSPERKNQLSDRSEEFYKNFFNEAKKLFGVESSTQIREKMSKVKDLYSKYQKTQKFIKKLASMIVQCSPSGSFENEPSTHQIWKWVTRLLEEYMKLKQSVSGENFLKVCSLLNATSIEEILEKILQRRGNFRSA